MVATGGASQAQQATSVDDASGIHVFKWMRALLEPLLSIVFTILLRNIDILLSGTRELHVGALAKLNRISITDRRRCTHGRLRLPDSCCSSASTCRGPS